MFVGSRDLPVQDSLMLGGGTTRTMSFETGRAACDWLKNLDTLVRVGRHGPLNKDKMSGD